MADVEANVDITVEGAGSLAEAAAEAEALKEALDGDRDAAVETDAALAGMKVSAAGVADSMGRLRDERGRFAKQDADLAAIAKAAQDRLGAASGILGGPSKREQAEAEASLRRMADLQKDLRSPRLGDAEASLAGGSAIDKMRTDLEKLSADLADAEPRIDAMNDAIGGSADKAAIAATALANWHDVASDRSADWGSVAAAPKELDGALRDFTGSSNEGIRALQDISGAAGDTEEALGGGGGVGGGLTGAMGDVGQSFGKLQGLAMPALWGALAAAATTAGPALLASAAGVGSWAALAAPALLKVKDGLTAVTAAQQNYQSAAALEKVDPTTAHANAQQAALEKLKATWAQMPAGVAGGVRAIQSLEHAFSAAGKPIQQQALKDIPKAIGDVQGLIPAMSKLAGAASPAIGGLLKDFGKFEKSKGFDQFISNIQSEVPGATKSLENLAGAGGSVLSTLFSKKNVGTGEGLINNVSGLIKSAAPGIVDELGQYATFLSGAAKTVTNLQKQGHPLQIAGRVFDDGIDGLRNTSNWVRTANKAGTDTLKWFFSPSGLAGGHGPSSFYQNMKRPVPTENIRAQQTEGARALEQGGTPALAPGKKGSGSAAGTETIAVKLTGAAGVEQQLAKLRQEAGKGSDAKIKVSVTGADAAKTAFGGVVTAAQTAGKQAGAAIGPGIASGAGSAKAAAAGVASGARTAVAPMPGAFRSTGSAAGAGMAAGISASTGAAVAAAASMAAQVEAAAKVQLQVQSPSKKFKKIGESTIEGLILGLEGGKAAVQAAMKAALGNPFKDASVASAITSLTADVRKALAAGKITKGEDTTYTALLTADNAKLQKLAKERATLERQISAADALAKSVQQAAVQSADLNTIAAATTAGQAAAAAGPGGQQGFAIGGTQAGPAQYGTIQQGLKAQLGAIQKFRSQIKELKKDGLDKQGIQELLAAGVTQGGATATQMLAGGAASIKQIAALDNSIGMASKKLGITGANAAYEAGSQIDGGLAAGLKAELKSVDTAMADISKALVTSLMTALGASPKDIKAALAKLDKELGLGSGASGGGSGPGKGKITPPHEIYHPKPTEGPFRQPGPIRAFMPALAGGGGGGGTQPIVVHNYITVAVDGQELARAVETNTLQHAKRRSTTYPTLPGRN